MLFKDIVGVIVLPFDALPPGSLPGLLSLRMYTIRFLLGSLDSVMDVTGEENIRLLHPSLRDFLTDNTRCIDPRFLINESSTHTHISLDCMNLMSKNLRKDICDLHGCGVLTHEIDDIIMQNHLLPDIRYPCSHWVNHLKECQTKDLEIGSTVGLRILACFRKNFLHWLEVLSLIHKVSEGVLVLDIPQNIIAVSLLPTISDFCI